jgi:hypothetical protein
VCVCVCVCARARVCESKDYNLRMYDSKCVVLFSYTGSN